MKKDAAGQCIARSHHALDRRLGVLLAPESWRLVLIGIAALALGLVDLGLVRGGLVPPWFGRLGVILSVGAGAAPMLSAFAQR